MIVNNVDIKVVTDYTAFTNTVRFQIVVPVSADDADKIYKDLGNGDWSQAETDITAAVKKSAPVQIQTLVSTLLKAYSGTESGTSDTPKQDDQVDDQNKQD